MTGKILVVGNSHTRMIARAAAARRKNRECFSCAVEVCWLTTPGKSVFGDTSREDALAKVRELEPDDLLVLTWLGTSHNILGLLEHDIPFTLMESEDGPVDVPAHAIVIPLNTMRQLLEDRIRGEQVVCRYSQAAACKVVHMMPPPPKEHIKRRFRSEHAEQEGAPMKFAPAPGRLALWKAEAALVRRYVNELGVQAYEHPADTRDTRGFLAEAYQASDITHANAIYGDLCLKDFEAMLAKVEISRNSEGAA